MTTNNNRTGVGQSQQTSTVSNGFTPVQNGVLNLLKTVTTITGYSVTEICKQLKRFSENQVKYVFLWLVECVFNVVLFRQALEFLSGEGHIYSTTDDDHYRAAGN